MTRVCPFIPSVLLVQNNLLQCDFFVQRLIYARVIFFQWAMLETLNLLPNDVDNKWRNLIESLMNLQGVLIIMGMNAINEISPRHLRKRFEINI